MQKLAAFSCQRPAAYLRSICVWTSISHRKTKGEVLDVEILVIEGFSINGPSTCNCTSAMSASLDKFTIKYIFGTPEAHAMASARRHAEKLKPMHFALAKLAELLTCPIPFLKVTTLQYKPLDDSMEFAAFVAITFLPCSCTCKSWSTTM